LLTPIEEGLRATELEPNYFIAQHLLGEAYWYSGVEPLRGHPRWPELAARMKLPVMAT